MQDFTSSQYSLLLEQVQLESYDDVHYAAETMEFKLIREGVLWESRSQKETPG
jgi:hypothetical protein